MSCSSAASCTGVHWPPLELPPARDEDGAAEDDVVPACEDDTAADEDPAAEEPVDAEPAEEEPADADVLVEPPALELPTADEEGAAEDAVTWEVAALDEDPAKLVPAEPDRDEDAPAEDDSPMALEEAPPVDEEEDEEDDEDEEEVDPSSGGLVHAAKDNRDNAKTRWTLTADMHHSTGRAPGEMDTRRGDNTKADPVTRSRRPPGAASAAHNGTPPPHPTLPAGPCHGSTWSPR